MGADSHTNYALRKNRRQEITPIHPELAEPLAEILDTTHGLIVYQEQVMAIAQKVAGFTLSQADNMRRAMGKKKKEILDAEFLPFSAGMQANGSGTRWSRSLTTPSTRRTPRHTGWFRTGRPTSRPTSPPSSWQHCLPR
jgi:DNA polymerase III alpha subunit